ncbi:tail fiber assembly protein [Xenorhabdus sp. PB61.4]|uniref:tail fiber assembly protein n=1 Tax=Xenorhabdus sp. PB61.4 TaxID=2788940 RepID=UPI001E6468FC|nr:tail fiber assembly protein [Xenorhabdus sp. PB61.4]MCC8364987.1 tail fiber assembly protein [Xenorhabdus sp. PB61.4]
MKAINYYYNPKHPLHPYISQGYANIGSLSPLDALRIAPEFKQGFCPCEKEGEWINVPDYRGVTVYDKKTAQPVTIDDIGTLPDGVTTLIPDVDFPQWEGEKWGTDIQARKTAHIRQAEQQKSSRRQEADMAIVPLQDAVDLDMATQEEQAALLAWKKYRVLLNRVDCTTAPDIDWPKQPK